MQIPEMKQKNRKKLLGLNVIQFESGMTNSQNPEQETCHWQSMCQETPPRFNISLKEIFSKRGSPEVMKKYDESALMKISQDFGNL